MKSRETLCNLSEHSFNFADHTGYMKCTTLQTTALMHFHLNLEGFFTHSGSD